MKKIASILLLAILLFNLLGYHFLFNYLQSNQQSQLEEQLYSDNKSAEVNSKSVKVPVTFPYYTNNKTFEPASGEINVNGTYYKVIKKRIYNDSLEIVYMIDWGKTELQSAKTDFVKQANGIETSKQGSKSNKLVKPVVFEYIVGDLLNVTALVSCIKPGFPFIKNSTILSRNSCFIDHPPESTIA